MDILLYTCVGPIISRVSANRLNLVSRERERERERERRHTRNLPLGSCEIKFMNKDKIALRVKKGKKVNILRNPAHVLLSNQYL